jgi:hypothetical protein
MKGQVYHYFYGVRIHFILYLSQRDVPTKVCISHVSCGGEIPLFYYE